LHLRAIMLDLRFLAESSPLYLAQLAFTIWMLVDAHRRGVEYYWFFVIFFFQPIGAWVYFFLFKVKEFRGGPNLGRLFQRRASLEVLRYQAEQSPTAAHRLELAERLVETGAYAEALPHLESVVAREPEHCSALFALAQSYRGLGRPGDAIDPLRKIIARHPGWHDYRAWYALIDTCVEAGDQPGAVTHCRELARVEPSLEHRCLLAEHLLANGEPLEARTVVERGLEEYRYLTGAARARDRRWVGHARKLLARMG
jgi:hypothetical protein